MKFAIQRDALHEVLQDVINVVSQRSPLPMTSNILLKASGSELEITGTDLEITIVSHTSASIEEEGAVAVRGRLLADVVRELPPTELSFELKDPFRLHVTTEMGEYTIGGEDPAQFPKRPEVSGETVFTLDNLMLADIIERTTFATSSEEIRPALTGVFFELEKGQLTAVATDSHRLAYVRYTNQPIEVEPLSMIVASRSLNLLLRSLEKEGQTTVEVGSRHVLFRLDGTLIYSRLIDEAFVNYAQVIPREINYELVVDKDQFLASLKRVSLFSSQMTLQVVLRIFRDYLEVSARDVDFGGEARERIPGEFTGEEMIIGFNSRYLQEVVRHIPGDQILMQFVRPDYAVVVKPVQPQENQELLMLLMPVRLEEV